MAKFVIEKEYSGYAIAKYLKEVQGYSSRSIRKIEVYLDNKRVKPTKKIRYLNVLKVIEKEKSTSIKPINLNIEIVYEDDEILLVNKPPYLLTHPTQKKADFTLANGIVYHFQELGINLVPRFYNRLDMNTSGIIVVTKSGFAQAYLQNNGEVEKYYQALVKGKFETNEFFIEDKIAISSDGIKREIREDGQEAKTRVKVVDYFEDIDVSLVELKLYTGRTHQIRVHLSAKGHPILGDTLYGGEFPGVERQFLHSYKIKYIDPKTKKKQCFVIDLADDMKKFLRKSEKKNQTN